MSAHITTENVAYLRSLAGEGMQQLAKEIGDDNRNAENLTGHLCSSIEDHDMALAGAWDLLAKLASSPSLSDGKGRAEIESCMRELRFAMNEARYIPLYAAALLECVAKDSAQS